MAMSSFFEATFPSVDEKIRIVAVSFNHAAREAFQVFSRRNSVQSGIPINFSVKNKVNDEQKNFVGTKILDNRPVDTDHEGVPVLRPYTIKVEEKN